MVILMTMSETRGLADVKAHLSELIAQVGAHHDRATATVHGRPTALLVAIGRQTCWASASDFARPSKIDTALAEGPTG